MPSKLITCIVCGFPAEVDGIGSKVNPKGTWLLRKSLPIVCKSFDPAGDLHDELYLRADYPKDEADTAFREKMHEISNKKMWGTQWHFHFWAERFYKFIDESEDAKDAYEKAQAICKRNLACLCMDQGLECDIHPSVSPR